MKSFDIALWQAPVLAVVMILVVLWRHFFPSGVEPQEPFSVPEPLSVPEPPRSLVRPVYQQQFFKRLSEIVAWTALLMKEETSGQWNNRTLFRKTNPLIDGVPAFRLEEGGVTWNVDICNADKVLSVLFNALLSRPQVSPATWQEMKTMGKIIAHEIQTTVADGGSEAASDGYVDVYDLPPVDTWIWLSGGPDGSNPILYCWVPNPFVAAMQGAMDVSCMANYEWTDIGQLLSDYKQ